MTETPYMIMAEGLTKRFGERTVVDNLTFTVNKGEVLGFLGPNAAGKTTTMRMITCFFPPSAGTVKVNDYDISEQSIQVRRSIGFLPENVPLYTDMKVKEYLEFVARAKSVPHLDRDKAIKSAMDRCNLGSVADQLIATVSRGYKQRVGLAQAIINNPPVLILDEPTVGLDPAQIKDIRDLIKELGKTSTVILSTHILPEVSLTCSRVVILNHGKILAVDTPENLMHAAQEVNTISVTLKAPSDKAMEALKAVNNVKSVSLVPSKETGLVTFRVDTPRKVDLRSQIASLVVGNNWDLFELKEDTLSLEDAFLNILHKDVDAESEKPETESNNEHPVEDSQESKGGEN